MNNRRLHPRINYHVQFDCNQYFTPTGELHSLEVTTQFKVCDLSVGGMQATSLAWFEVDSVLQFTFYLEKIPYIILCRVRWASPLIDTWQYGLEFLSIPNMLHRHLTNLTNKNVFQNEEPLTF